MLRGFVDNNPYDEYTLGAGAAGRAGLGDHQSHAQLWRPAAVSRRASTWRKRADAGPVVRSVSSTTSRTRAPKGPGPTRGGNRHYLNQSGIVWFPGSAPLYKGGRLVGGLGVSGDGVEQDDYVTAGAVVGFEPPPELRVDRQRHQDGRRRAVRLPYFKFPRNPELR